VEHHQVDQHTCSGCPKRRREIFAEIMVGNIPNLIKDVNINIKQLDKFQVRTAKIPTVKYNIISLKK